MTNLVSLKDVNFIYEDKIILDHVNLDIEKGIFMGLMGPNGGGKTTLIRIILGLLKADTGSVELFGQPIEKFKDWHKIGYVSQKSNAFNRGFPATVFEVVSMGLTAKIGYFKFFKQKHKEKVKHALKQVDMLEYMHQNIGDLSGGQQQRVFIARALVSNPEFLILDEPTVGIDQKNIKIFYELLHDLHRNKGITLLLVTHDVGTMTQHVDQVCCLNKKLHFHGDTDKYNALTDTELSNLYGHPVNLVQHNHQ